MTTLTTQTDNLVPIHTLKIRILLMLDRWRPIRTGAVTTSAWQETDLLQSVTLRSEQMSVFILPPTAVIFSRWKISICLSVNTSCQTASSTKHKGDSPAPVVWLTGVLWEGHRTKINSSRFKTHQRSATWPERSQHSVTEMLLSCDLNIIIHSSSERSSKARK